MAAATRKGKTIVFDATSDTYANQVVCIRDITFQGTGLTADDRVLLLDDGDDPVADYVVPDATANAQLWNGKPQFVHGLKMSGTVDGTWALTVFVD